MIKNKIIFELNEFNLTLLKSNVEGREYLRKFLDFHHLKTTIPDTYKSDFLEPWSQWVSIHSGLSCKNHGIKHLGDVADFKGKYVWDLKSDNFGVVWGCLNSKIISNKIKYFPDPWTTTSNTNIKSAKFLLSFMRKAVSFRGDSIISKSKKYLSLSLHFLFTIPLISKYIDTNVYKIIKKYGFIKVLNFSTIYCFIEYISFNFFLDLTKDKYSSKRINIFFSNFLAHCQHYYWGTEKHYRILICLDLIDCIFEKIYKNYDKIIILNGLSQRYSANSEIWHSYIPKNGWIQFIKKYISKDPIIEPLMSYDVNLNFSSNKYLQEALEKINSIKIFNTSNNLFYYEINKSNKLRLFMRLNYFGTPDDFILINNSKIHFLELFNVGIVRTAKHVQECNLLSNMIITNKKKYKYNFNLVDFYLN